MKLYDNIVVVINVFVFTVIKFNIKFDTMSLIVVLWVFPEIIIKSLIEPAGMINYHLNNEKVGHSIHGQYSERKWPGVRVIMLLSAPMSMP